MPNISDTPFYVVVPARYASTRLSGKLLLDIAGKPMLQHVYEKAKQSKAKKIIIAADDERLVKASRDFGAEVYLTSPLHECGTDRIAEVIDLAGLKEEDVIVNIQGDEPLIEPEAINQVAENLYLNKDASVATLYEPLNDINDLFDANIVKLTFDHNGYALYFSRAPIPWDRNAFPQKRELSSQMANFFCRHIGIYAYRCGFLKQYVTWQDCPLEKLECLEQLRILWHGYKIHVAKACILGMIGIDTESDLIRVRKLFK